LLVAIARRQQQHDGFAASLDALAETWSVSSETERHAAWVSGLSLGLLSACVVVSARKGSQLSKGQDPIL
jgi:hypothetical protein